MLDARDAFVPPSPRFVSSGARGLGTAASRTLLTALALRRIAAALFVWATVALIASPADSAQTDRLQESSTASQTGEKKQSKPFSPLHDFLGIDAETGQFKPQQSPAPAPSSTASEQPGQEKLPAGDEPRHTVPPRAAPTIDDLPRTAEEANEAFRQASQRISEGSFEDLTSVLGESMRSSPMFRLHRQVVWITVAMMLVYPIGIVLAELLGYLTTNNRSGLTELDRSFQRQRLWGRLTLAAVLAAVILLFGFGTANHYWWNQPTLLAIFAGAVLVLAALAAVLANWIRQSTRTYELDLIREVRREQLEIRADLDELRHQLQHTASP